MPRYKVTFTLEALSDMTPRNAVRRIKRWIRDWAFVTEIEIDDLSVRKTEKDPEPTYTYDEYLTAFLPGLKDEMEGEEMTAGEWGERLARDALRQLAAALDAMKEETA